MEGGDVKIRVIQYFLRNTPVGEHKEVLNDLKSIIGEELLSNEAVQETLVECLASHGTSVDLAGQQAMLTPFGRQGNRFIDPKLAKAFEYNPVTFEAESVEDIEASSPKCQLLQAKIDSYLTQHFSETAQSRVYEADGNYKIFLACPSLNLRNMWTGEWISHWDISDSRLTGEVNIRAHYFEEGNLQLNQKKEFTKPIAAGEDEAWASGVARAIFECDDQVHKGMHSLYEQIPQTCFKAMRRALPVTQTKFADIHRTKMLS